MTASQFTPDHRMHQYPMIVEQSNQKIVVLAKVVYPDGSVHQYAAHSFAMLDCLRGIDIKSGSEPPNNAKRLALSRSIKACNPSRTNAVFSCTPVNSTACVYKSSSIFSVVLMFGLLMHQIKHNYMVITVLNKLLAMCEKSNNLWEWFQMEVR
jgi:hypothetical protein